MRPRPVLAEAVNYLGTKSAGILACSPTCATNPWGNKTTPTSLTYPDGGSAKVWIEVIQAFNPPAVKVATYKIHSTGSAGNGPGQRVLEQTVTGQAADAFPSGSMRPPSPSTGTRHTFKESVFSKNCITGRDKMVFGTEPDAYFGIPPAAHSTQWISDEERLLLGHREQQHPQGRRVQHGLPV